MPGSSRSRKATAWKSEAAMARFRAERGLLGPRGGASSLRPFTTRSCSSIASSLIMSTPFPKNRSSKSRQSLSERRWPDGHCNARACARHGDLPRGHRAVLAYWTDTLRWAVVRETALGGERSSVAVVVLEAFGLCRDRAGAACGGGHRQLSHL